MLMRKNPMGLALGLMIGLAALMCFCEAAWAIQIDVSTAPRLGTTNRLANPDFEEGASGPLGWELRLGGGQDDMMRGEWSADGKSGLRSVYIESRSSDLSGYWVQRRIPVEPGESLLLSAWVKMGGGRVLMFAVGYDGSQEPRKLVYDDRRLYLYAAADHPLYPVFVEAEHLKGLVGTEWQHERFALRNSADATEVDINLGLYFAPGDAWFDRVYFGVPWVELSVDVNADDAAGGIARVEITSDGGRSVYDSGPLPAGTRSWAHTLQVAADAQCYTVVVTDAQGQAVEVSHC